PAHITGRRSAYRTTGGDDLLLCRTRHLVDGDVELDRDVTRAEHLDLLVLAHSTLADQVGRRYVAALREELGAHRQVPGLVLDAERVLGPAQLRGAHVQRHLPALETDLHRVAGLRALGAAPGRLALRGLTAPHAGLRGVR